MCKRKDLLKNVKLLEIQEYALHSAEIQNVIETQSLTLKAHGNKFIIKTLVLKYKPIQRQYINLYY